MSPLFALLPAVFLGGGTLIVGAVGAGVRTQIAANGLACLLVSILAYLLLPASYTPTGVIACIVAGILLISGNAVIYKAFKRCGVSYAMSLTTGQQLFLVSILGVALFGEWATGASKAWGILALTLLATGTVLVVYEEPRTRVTTSGSSLANIRLVSLATLLFSLYPILVQASPAAGLSVAAPVLFGAFLGAVGWTLPHARTLPSPARRDILTSRRFALTTLACSIWSLGIVGLLLCNRYVGVATSFPLSQLNVMFPALGGVYLLGETKTRKELKLLYAGLTLLIVGAICIGLAKAADLA